MARHSLMTLAISLALTACSASTPLDDSHLPLALGTEHTCAIAANGSVSCWGRNHRGQLGDGTRRDSGTPVRVQGLQDVAQVVAALDRTCARQASGRVFCWGARTEFLGVWAIDERQYDRLVPTPVGEIEDALDLAISDRMSCVSRESGVVTCWIDPGVHYEDEPPLDDTFGDVTGLSDVVQLDVAGRGCAVHGSGELSCFDFGPSRDDDGRPVIAIERFSEIHDAHRVSTSSTWFGTVSCLVHRGGEVSCWGRWQFDSESEEDIEPVRVAGIDDAADVAVAPGHACVLHETGRVSCWGLGSYGELGNGTTERSLEPTPVEGLRDVVTIGAGGTFGRGHTCAIKGNGEIMCWGWDGFGQLGLGEIGYRHRPRTVVGLDDAVQISAGANHTCAVRAEGELRCWGEGEIGQIGTTSGVDSSLALLPEGVGAVTVVEAGELGTCVALATGEIACWGLSGLGSVGLEEPRRAYSFEPRVLPDIVGVRSMSIGMDVEGYTDGCMVRDTGRIECSRNSFYPFTGEELEDGRVVIPDITDAVSVVYSAVGQCAMLESGGVSCWENTPGRVDHTSTDVAVDAGGAVLCLVRESGQVECVGRGRHGALGTGLRESWVNGDHARNVTGIDDAIDVSTGEQDIVCALHESGRVSCWGWSWGGVFGELEPQVHAEPVEIDGIEDAVQLATGLDHACALHESGSVSCWGLNQHGQLGDGRVLYRSLPTLVAGD